MDSRRFGAAYRSREYALYRTREIYETYYDVKFPGHERTAGRPPRLSPAYTRLQELGAAFGEKSGWERANWFEPNADRGDESLRPRGWAGQLWSPAIGVEHLACREAVAIFDETSFAKIDVSGEGSADFLERLCANRVARDVGAVTYTQLLNPRWWHRMRLHGHPPRRGPVPHRHRHRLRPARPRLDPPARPGRRVRPHRRPHVLARVPRRVGAEGARPASAAHDDGPRERVVPVHDRAGGRGRAGAVPGGAGHVRRRARLGALLPNGVRRAALGRALGGGARARARRRRLQGDRLRSGSRRDTASGGRTSLPRTRPSRRGSGLR